MMLRTYLQARVATVAGSVEDSVGLLEIVAVVGLASGFAELAFAPKSLDQDFVVVSVERLTGREILCDGEVSYS